jgi:WhiB family redox-sensing transcriptional regulator
MPDGHPSSTSTPRRSDVSILASSLTLAHADYSWRSQSLCRDTDPDLFFPIGTTGHALNQISRAKEVCGECPVSRQCLEFALETNQDSGIWGGTSEEERRVMRRAMVARNKAAAAG